MFCFLKKFTKLEFFLHFYTTGRDKFQVCIVVLCLRSRKQKSLFACICQSDFEFSLTTKEINPALNKKNTSNIENLALILISKQKQASNGDSCSGLSARTMHCPSVGSSRLAELDVSHHVLLCILECILCILMFSCVLFSILASSKYSCVFNCILVYSLNVSDGGLKSRLWWLPVLNASYAVEDNALHNGATSLEVG